MAATFSSFRTPIVSSAALPNPSKPDPNRRSNNWWTPIFGWPSEPDYIASQSSSTRTEAGQEAFETGRVKPEKNLFRGCFTEEKAKELRKKTIETSTFHDIMYHSAIASRLASDVSGRDDRWLWLSGELVKVQSLWYWERNLSTINPFSFFLWGWNL